MTPKFLCGTGGLDRKRDFLYVESKKLNIKYP